MAGMTRSSSSASVTSGPGPAFTPPTSRMSAPSDSNSSARCQQRVERERGALVVEGVGGPVQDAHDQPPRGQIERPVTEAQVHRVNLHAHRHGARGRFAAGPCHRVLQNRRVDSALRYGAVRGSSGPSVSRRSRNSWRASSSSFTLGNSASSSTSTPSAGTSTCWAAKRASAATWRASGVSGIRASSARASCGIAACHEQAGQGDHGAGVVGLELEGPAQRRLVARRDQPVGLGRHGGEALDELGDLGLGNGADEPVDDLAVLEGEDGRDRLHLEGGRDPRVLVHVDLHELTDPSLASTAFSRIGPEGATRPAPRGPQVDDDGDLLGAGENVLLEGGIGDVDHVGRRYRATARGPGRAGRRQVACTP